ncbi:MAG: DegT/DnrJ/EryC1/StrS family aminotransferase [Candidatus Omnitrophota bacterium]|nr:DegT/DnrJ/EryC1/StrS family aminotransferase [Candidatus Omnitrophota bacterium]
MRIPLLDLKREYEYLKTDIDKAVRECFESQRWILGPQVKEFEHQASKYLGVKFAFGVASGTDALVLALSALALKLKGKEFFDKEDEIITTPFTFVATAEAIVRCGATPVFVDINPDTYNICPEAIKKAVTKNTIGIIPVHLYGLPADMNSILEIAKDNDLFVVEDTAQAFGAEYRGKRVGTLGDIGAFSCFPSKNLGGCGDGGLIVANDLELAEFTRVLRNHGQKKKYDADFTGYNSRLDSIQAAILNVKLKHIDKFNELRRGVAQRYDDAFSSVKEIQVPKLTADSRKQIANLNHVYHLYTIKVDADRDKLLEYINSKGIESRVYYPVLLHKMAAFKRGKVCGDLKNSEDVLSRVLTLPIHPFLKEEEIEFIIEALKDHFK